MNITQESNAVRIIANTRTPDNKKMNDMIGEELEVNSSWYDDNIIDVWNKYKSNHWGFNKEDVRFLTPMKWKGNHIAIGDEVEVYGKWYKVLGYFMMENKVRLLALVGTSESVYARGISEITNHRRGEPIEMTIKQIEEKLNITGLKIIK